MKKSLLAIVASSALFFLACGDDSSSGSGSSNSRADLCGKAPKLTKQCLEGTWVLDHFENADGDVIDDGSDRTGGVLTFSVAKLAEPTTAEEFAYESDFVGSLAGNWTLAADSASFAKILCTAGDYTCSSTGLKAVLTDTVTLYIQSSNMSIFEAYQNSFVPTIREVYKFKN